MEQKWEYLIQKFGAEAEEKRIQEFLERCAKRGYRLIHAIVPSPGNMFFIFEREWEKKEKTPK